MSVSCAREGHEEYVWACFPGGTESDDVASGGCRLHRLAASSEIVDDDEDLRILARKRWCAAGMW